MEIHLGSAQETTVLNASVANCDWSRRCEVTSQYNIKAEAAANHLLTVRNDSNYSFKAA